MIRRRMRHSAGPTGSQLYAMVAREQGVNVKVWMPATVVCNLLAAVAVSRWPGALIDAGGHVIMAVGRLAAALGYLCYVMRFFTRIRLLIVTTRREWRDDVLPEESRGLLLPTESPSQEYRHVPLRALAYRLGTADANHLRHNRLRRRYQRPR